LAIKFRYKRRDVVLIGGVLILLTCPLEKARAKVDPCGLMAISTGVAMIVGSLML